MADFSTITKVAAVGAAVYLIMQMRKASVQESAQDESGPVRYAEYRPASSLFWNPVLVTRVYKDGPLSWVGEDSSGRKWISYTGGTTAPAVFRKNMTHKSQI
jgi:hypothetical protein